MTYQKFAPFLVAIILTNTSVAQVDLLQDGSLPYDTTTTVFANVNLYRCDNSNSISMEFGEKMVRGGHIDRGIKDRIYGNLETLNNYGASTYISANAIYFPENKKYGFGVGYELTSYQYAQFSDDLFELVFYGNEGFGNQQADLSSSSFLNYISHTISFTAVEKSTGSFVSLAVHGGFRYMETSIDKGSLSTSYTNSGEQSLASEVEINARYFLSEEFESQGLFGNNIGVGVNVGYNLKFGKHLVSVQGKDIGFNYVSGTELRDTSGTFNFSGIDWDYGSDSNPTNAFESLEDSISPDTRVSAGKLRVLPARFKLRYFTPISKKFSIAITGRYIFDLGFNPEGTAAVNYHLNQSKTVVWIDGTVGGFNRYSVGLGAQIGIGNTSIFTIGTRHATGFFYREATALSAYASYALRL